ncbi:MAG: hypothetical protein ACYDH3_00205 [Candidatus Aminicenantales bacterium]
MTPVRIVEIIDRKTRKSTWVKIEGDGPLPPLINPVRPNEPKDELSREEQEIRKRRPS